MKLIDSIKRFIPVSRGRYERELALVKSCVTDGVRNEKARLLELIDGISWIYSGYVPGRDETEIRCAVRVTNELMMRQSPDFRERVLGEIYDRLFQKLKAEIGKQRMTRILPE